MRLSFLLIICMLILAACAGPAAKSVSYTPPDTPGGRLCTGQCGQAQDYCREDCDLHQRQCVSKVQTQALLDYEKYMSEQFLHSDSIELRARDFERMSPCDDVFRSCKNDCESQFQGCYENCGGKVDVTTSCQALCF
jgi:hypothetical protein